VDPMDENGMATGLGRLSQSQQEDAGTTRFGCRDS